MSKVEHTGRAASLAKHWWLKGWITLEKGTFVNMEVRSSRVRDRSPDDLEILEVSLLPSGQLELSL